MRQTRQSVGGLVDVVQRDDLHGAVHVAVGDADQAGGDAGPGIWMALASVPVRDRAAASWYRISASSAASISRSRGVVHVGTAVDDRAAAQFDVALLPLFDGGAVGGVGHVDGDADVRIDAEVLVFAPRSPISSWTVETA